MLKRSKQMENMKRRMMSLGSTTAEPIVDCLVTAWSPWSECSATCESKTRQRGLVFWVLIYCQPIVICIIVCLTFSLDITLFSIGPVSLFRSGKNFV